MKRQFIVIGLGQFGLSIAREVSGRGHEVLAVDIAPARVQEAEPFVTQALAMDAADEHALGRLALDRRDVTICAIGDEAREAAIIVTTLARQLGARHVVARATDALMERILRLVGAHEVVNPERAYGEWLASKLLAAGVTEEHAIAPGIVLSEVAIPNAIAGRTLQELELPRRHQLNVVAIRRGATQHDEALLPEAQLVLEPGDVLVVVGRPNAAQTFSGRLS